MQSSAHRLAASSPGKQIIFLPIFLLHSNNVKYIGEMLRLPYLDQISMIDLILGNGTLRHGEVQERRVRYSIGQEYYQ